MICGRTYDQSRMESLSESDVLQWLSTDDFQKHIRAIIHNGEVGKFIKEKGPAMPVSLPNKT